MIKGSRCLWQRTRVLDEREPMGPQEGYGDTIYPALLADMTPSATPGGRCGSLLGLGARSSSVGDPQTGPGDLSLHKAVLSFRSITQSAAFQTARQRGEMPPTGTRDHWSWV
jgi:hypothetical protein